MDRINYTTLASDIRGLMAWATKKYKYDHAMPLDFCRTWLPPIEMLAAQEKAREISIYECTANEMVPCDLMKKICTKPEE
jgi:hypothetical protein